MSFMSTSAHVDAIIEHIMIACPPGEFKAHIHAAYFAIRVHGYDFCEHGTSICIGCTAQVDQMLAYWRDKLAEMGMPIPLPIGGSDE